jgi:hypothetical protein
MAALQPMGVPRRDRGLHVMTDAFSFDFHFITSTSPPLVARPAHSGMLIPLPCCGRRLAHCSYVEIEAIGVIHVSE